jgi:hypothetical protein
LALVMAVATAGSASSPSSGTVSPTSASTSWQGQHYTAAANLAGTALANPCPSAAQDPQNAVCDHFRVTVNADAAFWSDKVGGVQITIRWADSSNDFDLYVYNAAGTRVKVSAQGNTTFEQVLIPDASGAYEVRVAPFTIVDSGYDGVATLVARPLSTAPGAGPAAYHGVTVSGPNPDVAPQTTPLKLKKADIPLFQFVDTGFEAAEPTIGIRRNGTAFYAAATFDGILGTAHTTEIRSKDGGLTWRPVQPSIAGQLDSHPETLDPYTYVEEDSGRVFDIDLIGDNLAVGLPLGAVLSFSDDEGQSWTTTALTIPGLNDHQTIYAGPTPVGNPALRPIDPRFPEVLYYCVNQVSDSWCARSLDGGIAFVQGPHRPISARTPRPAASAAASMDTRPPTAPAGSSCPRAIAASPGWRSPRTGGIPGPGCGSAATSPPPTSSPRSPWTPRTTCTPSGGTTGTTCRTSRSRATTDGAGRPRS